MKNYDSFLQLRCCLPLFVGLIVIPVSMDAQSTLLAGFRASRILNSYPGRVFPSPAYWVSVGSLMANKFSGAKPAGIWIVSLYINNGITQFNFPSPGGSYPYVNFISTDQNEAYLSHFDSTGVKVWLQVEPGSASVDTLIHLVLSQYRSHRSVIGFGVDIEWYKNNSKVTDSEAERWERKVRSLDTSYTLFLKHYSQSWMPPSYRGSILFVDDSQDFSRSSDPLSYMRTEFTSWGLKFAPNKVGFQFGYAADSSWWRNYSDPALTIGSTLLSSIPNAAALFWVDFTITKVFPMTSVLVATSTPGSLVLEQNYPNPFNPATVIRFALPEESHVSLKIFNTLGQVVATLVDGRREAGYHQANWYAAGSPSGIYFYRLQAGSFMQSMRMILLR